MTYTAEARRENLAKAREARAAKPTEDAVAVLEKSAELAEPKPLSWVPTIPAAIDDDLKEKVAILWAEREAKQAKEEFVAVRLQGHVIVYQCEECGVTVEGLHPLDENRGAAPIECPNRYSKHSGSLTPMTYDPEA